MIIFMCQMPKDDIVGKKREYSIAVKKDGKFYVGYCLEIPQARGQGDTKAEAILDTKRAIKLSRAYLEAKKKNNSGLVTVLI
jgi:predicted RNase H-like HicB family nuclease